MKSILSILAALLILFSTMGFTWSTHICGGHRVKSTLSIGKTVVGCGMEENVSHSNCSNSNKLESNCCQDEYLTYQIEDSYTPKEVAKNSSIHVAVVFALMFCNLLDHALTKHTFNDYAPPPLIRDIPILIQSFII